MPRTDPTRGAAGDRSLADSDRGSEHMRAALHVLIEESAADLLAEVVAELAPLRAAIESLAEALLEAEDLTLSGP
jgi:hypothetical protein